MIIICRMIWRKHGARYTGVAVGKGTMMLLSVGKAVSQRDTENAVRNALKRNHNATQPLSLAKKLTMIRTKNDQDID
jgi:hypothetical protein